MRFDHSHKCPAGDCQQRVARDKLMCVSHWRMVPVDLQRIVYREYRLDRHSEEHWRACQAAIGAVNSRIGYREPE